MTDQKYEKIRAQIQGVRTKQDLLRVRAALLAEPADTDRQSLAQQLTMVASSRGLDA